MSGRLSGKSHPGWKHGGAPKNHRRPAEYVIWCDMRKRCNNKNHRYYTRYGGRGISVCSRWDDFAVFLSDMGPRPSPSYSIDRINNDGNYEPTNCRWATKAEQARNTSATTLITYQGETLTLCQWADAVGINRPTLCKRISLGWSIEEALTRPVSLANAANRKREHLSRLASVPHGR